MSTTTSIVSFSHLLATAFFKAHKSFKIYKWGIYWHILYCRTKCEKLVWLLLWGSHREHNIYVSEVSSAATVHLKRINKTQQWSTAFFHVCKSSVGGLSSPIKAETKQTKDLTRKAQTAAEISTVMVELDHFSKTCSFHSQKKNRMSWTG